MRRIHHKSNQGATLLGWSKNARPWQFGQAIACIARQLQVMLENCCAPDSIKIINRRSETDGPRDIWRASFESMRRFLKRALFQGDAYNHFTTAVPGRYGI